ncbi:MAG: glycosyltransferase family 4 protein [Candidatus Omnitrophica bacterium]|nr:glycosyltransferase family 4 protein [Candidatus Omnitrophota bacterium]
MHILFIEPSGAGGVSHCTYALARALGEQGARCDIITASRWLDRPLPDSVRVHRVFNALCTNPLRVWAACRPFRRQADIVHWQCSTYPRLVLAVMRMIPLQRIPWVYTVHNVLPHEIRKSSLALYGKTYKRMQGLIFHTNHSRVAFERQFPEIRKQHSVIPLGEYGFLLGEKTPEASPSPSPVILFFGNIRPYKGLDILIKAMPEIRRKVPDARLLIAGQALGPFEECEKLIQEHHLQSCVETRFGYIPDEEIPALLDSAAVAALPYRDIDQSAALMLMMAYGKAIAATRVGGIPEVIRDGETGRLVPPDDPQALAEAVSDLMLDPAAAKRLGGQARQDAQTRFSWPRIAEETIRFYNQLIKED